jgi:hypothetical protein
MRITKKSKESFPLFEQFSLQSPALTTATLQLACDRNIAERVASRVANKLHDLSVVLLLRFWGLG